MSVTPHPIPVPSSVPDFFTTAQTYAPFAEMATLATAIIVFTWSYAYGLPIAFTTAAFFAFIVAGIFWQIGAASVILVQVCLVALATGLFIAFLTRD